ncbi:MAG: hypothetical protein CMK67_01340 [Pseudoalteromonas sp.]|uniref:hypothetical protein n=1 Tax=uncultured Pseudoalteromonas sp. TaxID=114053 RepID=UPI000C3CD9D8|nr:hypothetical protein [uncultured Pseudoalteromonas sp.]MAB61774.1 hypothetical protein [Pseudoalteromonas sp.]|tara:strand:- start:342 stop:608 length:267 start_codon:yes stop_codon:yes gene_type:complete
MAQGRKTGGRKAGTPNKLTFDTRQVLVNVLADEFENLPNLLKELPPEARIDAICKLTKFAIPTIKPVTSGLITRKEEPETDMFDLSSI